MIFVLLGPGCPAGVDPGDRTARLPPGPGPRGAQARLSGHLQNKALTHNHRLSRLHY